ncbi:MAG: DNA polymerase III subunit delta' [Candidatus Latescibacterota bacterium]
MSLDRITGQQRAKAQISAWFASGRLPHAVLITGQEGVGKRRLALELAKAINCRQMPGVGCDSCSSCTKAESLSHPNVHVLLPLPTGVSRSGTDAEQFATIRETALEYLAGGSMSRSGSNLPKDHILLLQREMSFAPTEAPKRVAIIFEADCMQKAGANSLLKILEEPPRHAVFLLVSAVPDRLLPTVVSRCQRLPLRPLTADETRDQLVSGGMSQEQAELGSRLAEGNRFLPASVAGDDFDRLRQLVERFIDSALSGREDEYWSLLEDLGGRPDKQKMEGFLGLCSAYLRDLFLIDTSRESKVANVDRTPQLAGWSGRVDRRRLAGVAESLDAAFDSQRHNVSPQLLLADIWHQLRRSGIVGG